jgi:hypothetical protein
MADVFISYARENAASAKRLAEALEHSGCSTWWDRDIPAGTSFDDVIASQIQACQCMLVLWSTISTKSAWVREEAMEGLERKILIPVLLEAVKPPLGFRRLQCASLTEWNGKPDHDEYVHLLSSIAALIGSALNTTPRSPPQGLQELQPVPRHRWQELVLQYIISEFRRECGLDLSLDHLAMARLAKAGAKAAKELEVVSETSVNLPYITSDHDRPYHLSVKVSRKSLEIITDSQLRPPLRGDKD